MIFKSCMLASFFFKNKCNYWYMRMRLNRALAITWSNENTISKLGFKTLINKVKKSIDLQYIIEKKIVIKPYYLYKKTKFVLQYQGKGTPSHQVGILLIYLYVHTSQDCITVGTNMDIIFSERHAYIYINVYRVHRKWWQGLENLPHHGDCFLPIFCWFHHVSPVFCKGWKQCIEAFFRNRKNCVYANTSLLSILLIQLTQKGTWCVHVICKAL